MKAVLISGRHCLQKWDPTIDKILLVVKVTKAKAIVGQPNERAKSLAS